MYVDAVIKEVEMGMKRRRVRFLEDRREWRLPGLLHTYDLVLKVEVKYFVKVCRRKGLKVNGDKSKFMVLSGEEELV